MAESDCIFCKILAGSIPSTIVYEDEAVVAFLDAFPVAKGHCLVVPRKHYATLDLVPQGLAAALGSVLPIVMRAVTAATGTTAFNVVQNNGAESGQQVHHVHFHILPRSKDDGVSFTGITGHPMIKPEVASELKQSIKPVPDTAAIVNFSAGPAKLPEPVLREVQRDIASWHGCGMGVMELSHRGPQFGEILDHAHATFREVFGVPDNYKVLFLQGGAFGEFAAIPMNLMRQSNKADYIVTGQWSKKAFEEAKKFGDIACAASIAYDANDAAVDAFLQQRDWSVREDAAYVHFCNNETVHGVELNDWLPKVPANVPIVCDMSSNFLSRDVDVSRYGVIYGGAQKNMGPSGVTVVIVRDDLLDRFVPTTPSVWNWSVMAANKSMLNTPPCFAIYVAGLVFQWVKDNGGCSGMDARASARSARLYAAIDANPVLSPLVKAVRVRSRMNIPFRTSNADGDAKFLAEASKAGMLQLKGHRSIGGLRASLYNAMTDEGVDRLIAFINAFTL